MIRDPAYDEIVADVKAAMLACGNGQGVAILPDGTLWAIKGRDPNGVDRCVILVPLSAEAGDTDG